MKLTVFCSSFFFIVVISGCTLLTEENYGQHQIQKNTPNWQKIGEANGNSLYVDVANIKKHDEFIFYWELINFGEEIYGANSRVTKFKGNCLRKVQSKHEIISYS